MCGLGEFIDRKKIRKHLASVFKYNYRKNLSRHVNTQRPTYALGDDGGLLVCSWPKGVKLSLPFPYSNEVWTGYEYQVASHMMFQGLIKEAVTIVKTARKRYDGRLRNPFDEYECGHWYGRALSSYGLLQAYTGLRYDAVENILYINPAKKGDFKAFFCAAGGYGKAGIRNGKPFFRAVRGNLKINRIIVGGK